MKWTAVIGAIYEFNLLLTEPDIVLVIKAHMLSVLSANFQYILLSIAVNKKKEKATTMLVCCLTTFLGYVNVR